MGTIGKVFSASLKGSRRLVKLLLYGKGDTQEVHQSTPYGTDSHPIKDAIAVYMKTGTRGESVVVGYVNVNQIADVGEHRVFSTDADGNVQFFIHQKNDGTCEIGGDADFMVRYTPLQNEISQTDLAINTELGKIAAAITALGGAYTPSTISTDISAAKIEEIKTL